MVTGITDIRLEPPLSTSEVTTPIQLTMDNAIRMRASVAYWTISENGALGAQASQLLLDSESFLCVDIHQPTNLDVMESMSRTGANIYLHLERIPKQNTPESRHLTVTGMPKHLLHQKLLLFDLPNGEAELWIGSHNWTRRALEGPNVEASIVLALGQESPLYKEALANLVYARDIVCKRMDPDRIEDDKAWQRGDLPSETDSTIVVEGTSVENLGGEFVRIFGTDLEGYQSGVGQLRIGNQLHFVAYDGNTGTQYVYYARITATGLLGGANAQAESLGFLQTGRWSDKGKRGDNISVLEAPSIPPQPMVDASSYWVTVEILQRRRATTYEPLKRAPLWLKAQDSPLLDRMREKRDPASQVVSEKPNITIQVPNEDRDAYMPRDSSLDMKRHGGTFPLVVKRLIIPDE